MMLLAVSVVVHFMVSYRNVKIGEVNSGTVNTNEGAYGAARSGASPVDYDIGSPPQFVGQRTCTTGVRASRASRRGEGTIRCLLSAWPGCGRVRCGVRAVCPGGG